VTYLELPVGRFLELLAGAEPAPSGGGAAALAVSMGAGLCAMTARLSARQLAGQTAALVSDMERIATAAASLIQADADSYAAAIAARRSAGPGSGQAAAALAAAADVPMEIAGLAVPVARAAARLAAGGNPNLRGDAITGALLAAAGARAAAVLVDINLADRPGDGRPAHAARLADETAVLAAAAQRSPRAHPPGPAQ
jgi:methenyltetrahydrofolate cyclohydrolase